MRLALALLLVASPLSGQAHISMGLLNAGPVAQERTHHVRMGAMGRDVYIAIGVDAGLFTAKLMHMPTHLVVWECEEVPCEPISRFHYRAPQESHAESFALSVIAVGARWRLFSAGLTGNVIHGARPQLWGATPMLVAGGWAEARATYRGVGLEIGSSVIPRQPARWVALDEIGGGKKNGAPYSMRQRTILIVYVGVTFRSP